VSEIQRALEDRLRRQRRTRHYRYAGGYSPLSLFSQGEVGGWWDPSDTSTLFQDAAGTTPVTTLGQPVGLVIDKSKGGLNALGAELVTNGDFSNGTTGWSPAAVTQAVVGGELELTATVQASSTRSVQSFSTVVGATYRITASSRNGTGTFAVVRVGTTSGGSEIFNPGVAVGAVSRLFVATTTTTFVSLVGAGNDPIGSTYYFGPVSVREVPGNHLVQTTDTARPRWDARSNLLTQTEALTNAPWSLAATATRAVSDTLAPDGTLTAFRITDSTSGNSISQTVAVVAATFVGSVWMRSRTGAAQTIRLSLAGTTTVSIGTEWTRYDTGGVALGAGSRAFIIGSPSGAIDIDVWRPQLEFGSVPTQYQRVTTATDYADIGLPRYLSFDGFDDFLRTAVGADINFTSTDEMTVCCGVRKLSDATRGTVAHCGDVFATDQSWALFAPIAAPTIPLGFSSRTGGTQRNAQTLDAAYNAPLLAVLTGTNDISASDIRLRFNGAQLAQATAAQTAATYGTFPLFVGRRNGASDPFNGRLNQLVIRNRLTADGDLANLERFVAAKTGVTL
jgi:hypothetical protein